MMGATTAKAEKAIAITPIKIAIYKAIFTIPFVIAPVDLKINLIGVYHHPIKIQ